MAIPTGLIAIWSGTLGTIPANWNLCDGSGVTPDLRERFVRGASAVENPGTVGGADSHTHASQTAGGTHTHTPAVHSSHSHTTSTAGGHTHGSVTLAWPDFPGITVMAGSAGPHSHTTGGTVRGAHNNLTTDIDHTHTINVADCKPLYYEVAFIQAGAGAAIVNGIIIMWTGTIASIPANWDLCDGGGTTPNLLDRFVRGNRPGIDPAGPAGNATHIHTLVARAHTHGGVTSSSPTHTHTMALKTVDHNHNLGGFYTGTSSKLDSSHNFSHTHAAITAGGAHSHTVGSGGSHAHTVETAANLPPYYDVAYIMANGAIAVPTGGVLIWTGTRLSIPTPYEEINALQSRFAKNVLNAGVDPGGTGGSATHTHTENGLDGAHNDHAIQTTGTHTHPDTDTTGAHTHTVSTQGLGGTDFPGQTNASGGDHSHTVTTADNHTHTIGVAVGDHDHEPWSTDDVLPAYMNVVFVKYTVTTAYIDIATRFKLISQSFIDVATRFKLWARGFKDTATRFQLTVENFQDVATRFNLIAQGFQDVATRFVLNARDYIDTATRFSVQVRGYLDVATRFRLVARAFVDVATRFRLNARNYTDTATRFALQVTVDVATRFLLHARDYVDVATRFLLEVRDYVDTATRFRLIAQSFTDIPTRFRLVTQAYVDVATRFRLIVQSFTDIATRFLLVVHAYVDTATRFRLIVQSFIDIPTRFRIIASGYVDTTTRFFLNVPAHGDTATRFFLYVPTWKELQIQAEIAALEARVDGLRTVHIRV